MRVLQAAAGAPLGKPRTRVGKTRASNNATLSTILCIVTGTLSDIGNTSYTHKSLSMAAHFNSPPASLSRQQKQEIALKIPPSFLSKTDLIAAAVVIHTSYSY